MTPRVLDAVLHDDAFLVAIDQPGGKYLAQRRSLVQRLDLTLIEGVLFYPAPNLAGQVFGYDAIGAINQPPALTISTM
jgi:hypothetical protein